MDLSPKGSRLDNIYGSGFIGVVILMAFTFFGILIVIAAHHSDS